MSSSHAVETIVQDFAFLLWMWWKQGSLGTVSRFDDLAW